MQSEELLMRVEDRDRLKVLHGVIKGHIRQSQAAQELGLSRRWVKKLVGRVRREGDRGVMHRLRGRPSNRKIAAGERRQALALIAKQRGEQQWHDWGPTLLAEELAAEHGLEVSRETLRQWMIQAKLWRVRRASVEKVHLWRPRRERCGELVQWDTSEHEWLEGRGPKLYLIAMIDDATSRALARFARSDSREENLRLLGSYLERYGRPVEFYTDKASLFCTTPKAAHHRDAPEQQPTQIGRALGELGIGWLAAHSPQAKGRIERFFGTAQDRLVKGLRQAGAGTLEQANRYLEQVYLPLWNRRFVRPAAHPHDAHRALDRQHQLLSILSRVESRVVAQDYTIRLDGRMYQIPRAQVRRGLRGTRVAVEQRLDGSLWLRWREHRLALIPAPSLPVRSPTAKPAPPAVVRRQEQNRHAEQRRQQWMQAFWRNPSRPIWKAIRDSNAQS